MRNRIYRPGSRASRGGSIRRAIAALSAMLAALLAGPAAAQDAGNVESGRRIAAEWCGSCHLIGPNAAGGGTDAAPPFAVLAADPETTEFRLRAFLMTPHQRMPDFRLSRTETDDIVAYILSLRRP